MNKEISILFPHQLFKEAEIFKQTETIFLVEEFLFFTQYKFHKQKLVFHRASMKAYETYLKTKGKNVRYIDATDQKSDIRKLINSLKNKGVCKIHIIDPTDNWLIKRIKSVTNDIEIVWYNNTLFINSKDDLNSFFKSTKKKFFQTSFYKHQRTERNILMNNGKPEGGKWTYDNDNRKKYPKGKVPPTIQFPIKTVFHREAETYVAKNFNANYGNLSDFVVYPINFSSAQDWLEQFLYFRFHDFGIYEDAMVYEEHFLNHSILSPLINVGLLDPVYVVYRSIEYAKENKIPLNSLEGFVRQILGWREFIRGVYEVKGNEQRTKNFWQFTRKIPSSFYEGTTGVEPIDTVIKKVLKTGYAHHIERLMVLGNFMVLCEFHPDEVYQWFMELFIDAYDWVMVPNVYGMSLFADGGIMSTKPYISSSNYIIKMSNYKKGDWQDFWDGLFWSFMDKRREFFLSNPRLGMLVRTFDKMKSETKNKHLKNAERFFLILDRNERTN